MDELFCRHRVTLMRMALAATRNRADAEDLVQAAFVRALEHEGRFANESNLRGWLGTVLHRLAIDQARSRKRHRHVPLLLAHEGGAEPAVPKREPEPEWSNISAEDLEAAALACGGTTLEMFRLRHVEGLSYAQIAARLNVPLGTVATRLRRARSQILSALRAVPT